MQDPIGTIRVVRMNVTSIDPAVASMTPEQMAGYFFDRDPAKLAITEGMTPTWFVLEPLPRLYAPEVLATLGSEERQRVHAFRACCHRVERPEGPMECDPKAMLSAARGVKLASEQWVLDVADEYGMDTIEEMGAIVIKRARLPKGARGPLPLPSI